MFLKKSVIIKKKEETIFSIQDILNVVVYNQMRGWQPMSTVLNIAWKRYNTRCVLQTYVMWVEQKNHDDMLVID